MQLTIQQERAKFALERIQHLSDLLGFDEQKEFISYASGLPAMIVTSHYPQVAAAKIKSDNGGMLPLPSSLSLR